MFLKKYKIKIFPFEELKDNLRIINLEIDSKIVNEIFEELLYENSLKSIKNLFINEINSQNLQNQPSTSGYRPNSPKM